MGFSQSEKHLTTTSLFSTLNTGQYILIRDQKTDGVSGGTFTAGVRTRDLNTIVTDETGQVTLNSNQFTLPAGTYRIWAEAPAYRISNGYAWLQNITDGQMEVQGCCQYDNNNGGLSHTYSFIVGQFTISATKTFEIQHYAIHTYASTGFGVPSTRAVGDPEIYTQVQLTKVA